MIVQRIIWIAVLGLITFCFASPALAQNDTSVDSALTVHASLARDSSVWERLAPDTTKTDFAGGLTNFGYVTARAIGAIWQFLWKQVKSVLERAGRFLERLLGDEDDEKNLLRLPFSKRT